MADILILNFEGADGATSWTEEVSGLVPTIQGSAEIDTDEHYSGLSSVQVAAGSIEYEIPEINSGFTYTGYFKFQTIDDDASSYQEPVYLYDNDGDSSVYLAFYKDSGNIHIACEYRDKNGNGDSIDEIISLTADDWHKAEILVSGSVITVKIDGATVVSWDTGISTPLSGLDRFIFDAENLISGDPFWFDEIIITLPEQQTISVPEASVALAAYAPGYNVYGIPAAALSIAGIAPYRHNILPAAGLLLSSSGPGYGIPYCSVPVNDMTLLARSPAAVWAIKATKEQTARIIYRCYLTGAGDGVDDVELPLSAFTARIRDGEPSYLSCNIPDVVTNEPLITERTSGDIVIKRGYLFADGTEQLEEIVRVDYESLQLNQYANNNMIIITGHRTLSSGSYAEHILSGMSFYGLSSAGKQRIRADINLFLRPGDCCIYGDDDNDYMFAGQITYYVQALPVAAFMEVEEA